jgi:hypothetical protein
LTIRSANDPGQRQRRRQRQARRRIGVCRRVMTGTPTDSERRGMMLAYLPVDPRRQAP